MFVPLWVIGLAAGLAIAASAFALHALVKVRRGAATFRAVAEGSSDGLVLMERDSRILWANEAYCRIMGYPLEQVLGRYPLEFALPPHLAMSREEARAFRFDPAEERFGKLTQIENIRSNGELFMHEFSHAVIRTGGETRYLLASRDVTERIEREQALIAAQEKLRLLSRQDSLTGLSNRHCHAQTLAKLVGSGEAFAVLQIDMNDFKHINDTYGHTAGDALLAHFADVLGSLADKDWHCARVGGDEFTVLIPDVWALGVALDHARRIFHRSQVPMKWHAGELLPSVSVGAAVFNGQGQSADDMLTRADIALYAAKAKSGERVAGYDDDMHRDHEAHQALQHDLSEALSQGGVSFELTPVVDVARHCLVRFDLSPVWHHPRHGRQSHAALMHTAGQIHQIDVLERRMLQCARECLTRMARHDLGDVGIGLALSGAIFADGAGDDIGWLLDAEDPLPRATTLTIPADCLLAGGDRDAPDHWLSGLSDAGVRILLDNPGLSADWVQGLAKVTVDGICLDADLVRNVPGDKTALALVTATAGFAAALGTATVSRSVSSEAQIKALSEIGCTEFSGPVISRPMTLDQALVWRNEDWPQWSAETAPEATDLSA